jgi:glycosyltransferase involved in cell wall biosynthesis
MRIGLVTACFTPVINGVVRMVALYKKYLEEAGHDITVFTLGRERSGRSEEGVIRSPALPLGRTGYHLSARYSKRAQELVRSMELLHCHHPVMALELANRYGRCPVVFTNHTRYDLYLSAYSPLTPPVSKSVMSRLWPVLAEYADVVVAPSDSVRDLLLAMGIRTPVELIYNGIELDAFQFVAQNRAHKERTSAGKRIHCIYVGRLSVEKNVSALIDEFAAACTSDPRLHLTLVGDGPQRDHLQDRIQGLDLEASVSFTGQIDFNAVPVELAKAEIFVTSSVSEVHPLTVIEAMAAGLPVVAADSPGISDLVVDQVSGLLGSDEAGSLAERLVYLAADCKYRERMGQEAARTASQFRIQNTITKTLKVYERLLAERPDIDRRQAHRGVRQIGSWRSRWSIPAEKHERKSR